MGGRYYNFEDYKTEDLKKVLKLIDELDGLGIEAVSEDTYYALEQEICLRKAEDIPITVFIRGIGHGLAKCPKCNNPTSMVGYSFNKGFVLCICQYCNPTLYKKLTNRR